MRSIVVSLFFCIANLAIADSPKPPSPIVTSSYVGDTYFTMLPQQRNFKETPSVIVKEAHGKAYKLKENGESELLWEVSGWYAFSVFMYDEHYLVRMGNWATGSEASDEDLAVAFYKDGKELKSYSTKDLLKDPKKVEASVSHYRWQEWQSGYPKLEWDKLFKIKTIDGYVHTFNIEDGSLIDSTKSWWRVW